MIDLKYSLVIEATDDPNFSDFILPIWKVLPGSVIPLKTASTKRNGGMEEHVELLKEQKLPVPKASASPKIIIQNDERLARSA